VNVGTYQAKQYPYPPCWFLVADVYASELGVGVGQYEPDHPNIRSIASAFRLGLHRSQHGFVRLSEPVDMCVALMAKTERIGLHHCGIYFKGRVLHALDSGVFYEEMMAISDKYAVIEYWGKP